MKHANEAAEQRVAGGAEQQAEPVGQNELTEMENPITDEAMQEKKGEKTREELDYEAGYYACCFRSH